MTAAEFRESALALPETSEGSHVDHPDFRVCGKIFATLGYPDDRCGVLLLTPEEQGNAIGRFPEIFSPVKGGWGRGGSTVVLLSAASDEAVRPWMESAWKKAAPKRVTKRP